MFGFDEDLVTNFEVWCRRSVFVGGDLVSFLSVRDHRSELLVKFVEVYYKVAGAEEFALGIDPKSLHTTVLMQTVYNAVVRHSRGFLKHVVISVAEKRRITVG